MNLLGLTTSTTPVVTTQPEIDGRCPRCGRPVPIHKRGGRRRVWYSDARRAIRLGIASWDRQRLQVENSPVPESVRAVSDSVTWRRSSLD